jgi:hypothetical protein
MAKIVHSAAAPAEPVRYSLGNAEFELSGRTKSYETNDPTVLANAESHPWLEVQRDKVELVRGAYAQSLRPEDDHLSAINSKANDPEAVKAAQQAEEDFTPVAIEAGLNQTDKVINDGIAETLAADPTSKTSDKVDDN